MKVSNLRSILLCSSTASLALAAAPAWSQDTVGSTQEAPGAGNASGSAQDTERLSEANEIDDIVVTARRVEERLQDVPVAVTAFTGEGLRERNITNSYDLPLFTPGLAVRSSGTGMRNSTEFFIRGQGQSFAGSPSVLPYFAEVPAVSTAGGGVGSSLFFYDLNSIQVLKGPQGTLFGRALTGGAVLVEPKRPSSEFDGFVEARLGNLGYKEFTGALNVPIIEDKVMIRFAGQVLRRHGFTRSDTTGQRFDDQHRESYRIGLLLKPIDAIESYTVFYGSNADEVGGSNVLLQYNPNLALLNTGPGGAGRGTVQAICGAISTPETLASCVTTRVARLDALANELSTESARVQNGGSIRRFRSSEINQQVGTEEVLLNNTTVDVGNTFLGDLTLKNIFSTNRGSDVGAFREVGGSGLTHLVAYHGFDIVNGRPVIDSAASGNVPTRFFQNFTNESQIQGTSDHVNWLIGYFVDRRHQDRELPTGFTTFNNAFTVPLDSFNFNTSSATIDSKSTDKGLFGQAIVRLDPLVPGLSLTGGYRKSWTSRSNSSAPITITPAGAVVSGPSTPGRDFKEKANTYTLTADYKVSPDLLLYVAHRKGYKPGGINPILDPVSFPGAPQTFAPESLKDVELGVKSSFRSGDIVGRVNLAGYYQWYSGIQRNRTVVGVVPPFTASNITDNIAAARLYGMELESQLNIGSSWQVFLNYAYLNAKYTDYPGSTVDILGNVNQNIDTPFVGSPKHQASLGVKYFPIQSEALGDVSISSDLSYQSKVVVDDNIFTDPLRLGVSEERTIINLRIDWANIMGGPFDAAIFVKNATDKVFLQRSLNLLPSLGTHVGIFSEPRTFGLELRYRFGASGNR